MVNQSISNPDGESPIQPRLLSLGSTGFTFKINRFIVAKRARPGRAKNFYYTDEVIFLEAAEQADLSSLLRQGQIRDSSHHKVLQVTKLQPLEHCFRWMKQIISACSWMEKLGLAHCDIRPGNILLFHSGLVKLADFDRTIKVGGDLLAGTEPFARLLGPEGGDDRGTYGQASARTEQFALGSVFYCVTRGLEPYEEEWHGRDNGLIRMKKLQDMQFPPIGDLRCDHIIDKCWHGQYDTVAHLFADITASDGDTWEVEVNEDPRLMKEMTHECKKLTKDGILKQLMPKELRK